jgi:hypothetical protein
MKLDASDLVQVLDAETWLRFHRRLREVGGPPLP